MQSATNLQVTRQAREVALAVYGATRQFPRDERFGLSAQMRRAAVSIGSNICEGCGRSGDRELANFLQIALGSASELEFQLSLALDPSYLSAEVVEPLSREVIRTKKMLARLISSLRTGNRPQASPESGRRL